LKNALDWVSRLENQPFRDKPVAIQSATGGPIGGAGMRYHLRMALTSSIQPSSERREYSSGLLKPSSKAACSRTSQPKKVAAEQLAAFAKFIARPKASAC
jgi:chromate reductase